MRSASRSASDQSRDGKLCGRYLYASASRSYEKDTRFQYITASSMAGTYVPTPAAPAGEAQDFCVSH